MPKKILKRYVKDIATFTGGSLIIGAGATAVGGMGSSVAVGGGMTTLASGMGAVAPLVAMKPMVGMLGQTTKMFEPKKRRRK